MKFGEMTMEKKLILIECDGLSCYAIVFGHKLSVYIIGSFICLFSKSSFATNFKYSIPEKMPTHYQAIWCINKEKIYTNYQ